MRIFLIESGGFVGVPLWYEVDLSELDRRLLQSVERTVTAAAGELRPAATSAGEVRIRIERDDGRVDELTVSRASPAPRVERLIERLRACAKPVRGR